jgi:quinol-cytochrome oxidoreductase complex cytochrome b subunit
MKQGFVKSSPTFFRLIKIGMLLFLCAMLMLAALFPAPLQEAANPALTPNPVKSAWFLLWIQELVSYSGLLINAVILLGLGFLALPWLAGSRHIHRARWFPREQRPINLVTVAIFLGILLLTVVALFLRGSNWSLIFPS